jgi:inner membrane protein
MPSPVGHSLTGYIIYRAIAHPVGLKRWQILGLSLLTANAADLDFIPGFLAGDPNRYHHGISHSLGVAVLWAAACGLWLALAKRVAVGRTVALLFGLYSSHLVLDWLGIDTAAPYGIPFWWPLSNAYHIAPFAFWLDIQRDTSSAAFFPSLLSLHNLWAVSIECLALFPIVLLIGVWRSLANSSAETSTRGGKVWKPK